MTSIFNYVCILTILSVNTTFGDVISDMTIEAPYYFGYNKSRDTIRATLFFDNNSTSDVEVYSMESKLFQSDKSIYVKKWKAEPRRKFYYNYQNKLDYDEIVLELSFEANASCLKPLIVFKGKATDRTTHTTKALDPGYKYDDRCLRSEPCQIHMYLPDKCPDAPSVTADKSQKGSETSILVIVLSSLLSIVFIVLVVIVIWICWNKQSPQGTRGVQPNHTDRFYSNLLFRRECDREIAELEGHHYEEIDPGAVERSQNVR